MQPGAPRRLTLAQRRGVQRILQVRARARPRARVRARARARVRARVGVRRTEARGASHPTGALP